MEDGISVIICCYNSELLIEETLDHLKGQVTNKLNKWELILVDNNCTDKTVESALKVWKNQQHVPLYVVRETVPGLMSARTAGVNFAHYSYTVFCDDDNHLQNDYLEQAFLLMSSDDSIGIAGGMSEAKFQEPPPVWFSHLQSSYAVGKQASASGDVTLSKGHVWGAGMVGRTEVFKKILREGFITSGRKGSSLASGDDTELCYRVVGEGFKVLYASELKLHHFIPRKRLTWKYAVDLNKGHTVSVIKLAPLRRKNIEKKTPVAIGKIYKDLLYLIGKAFRPSLFQAHKFLQLKKHPGNMKLWNQYFELYYLYVFFRVRVLKRSY